MTEPANDNPKRGNGLKLIALAGLAGAVIGLAAIYGIGLPDGNSSRTGACAASLKTAADIKPLATGEVAAFLPTTKALDVSHLAFKSADGKDMTVADFKGKTVLLNLWATWCAPCRKEMPALDRLEGAMGSDRFQVVPVNVDTRGGDRPWNFMKEINVTHLPHYADDTMGIFNEMRSMSRATGLPTTMLVSPEGCEIGTMYGPAEWDSADAQRLLKAAMGEKNEAADR
ncbi:thiol-disulfide isomerase/thioredoxin [Breoghania corrubedonensis]|uniref:Thiol-disulfide isomerase/thioredoxin n=1 Tax=Breoghania corrubedonensis TaxID=665038 RepID=A0A2T5VI59_9HYPH|nr:TlpA disulfide reductase family protein [Breoghania corrubedonensis]PTW63447.1 thiol-disulfide isomerase/thioredoxin [Breoghania corrubedonensis]